MHNVLHLCGQCEAHQTGEKKVTHWNCFHCHCWMSGILQESNSISSTKLPQWIPRHYLWNNCHQPPAGATHTHTSTLTHTLIALFLSIRHLKKGTESRSVVWLQQSCSRSIRGSGFGSKQSTSDAFPVTISQMSQMSLGHLTRAACEGGAR